ncbi:hypothetical protein [Flavobacterium sp.]|jgi:hypothetical protein|uniref:hypothetical protein n=1 Tax=Flavobacterium sp. TaxID=239 RepID=UPI002A811AA9|nr:hypothetical protein [Flavobacterium sp.]
MKKITSLIDLRTAIQQLEQQQLIEEKLLKEQLNLAYNSIKPVNILLNTIKDFRGSSELKNTLLNASVGLGAVYASKKIFQSKSFHPLKNMIGSALIAGITNVVSKNSDTIISLGNKFFDMLKGASNDERKADNETEK